MKKIKVARSAVTGRFVKKSYAKRYPHLTVVETVRRRSQLTAQMKRDYTRIVRGHYDKLPPPARNAWVRRR